MARKGGAAGAALLAWEGLDPGRACLLAVGLGRAVAAAGSIVLSHCWLEGGSQQLHTPTHPILPPPCPSPAGADIAKLEAAAAAGGRAAATKGVARSDSVLVVKNLPYSATEAELEALFGAVGEPFFCMFWFWVLAEARVSWAPAAEPSQSHHVCVNQADCGPALPPITLPCRPAGAPGAADHAHAGAGGIHRASGGELLFLNRGCLACLEAPLPVLLPVLPSPSAPACGALPSEPGKGG